MLKSATWNLKKVICSDNTLAVYQQHTRLVILHAMLADKSDLSLIFFIIISDGNGVGGGQWS